MVDFERVVKVVVVYGRVIKLSRFYDVSVFSGVHIVKDDSRSHRKGQRHNKP